MIDILNRNYRIVPQVIKIFCKNNGINKYMSGMMKSYQVYDFCNR